MASCQMILEYGLYISSPGWWHEGEYGLYISSPGWWHEDEFFLHISSPGCEVLSLLIHNALKLGFIEGIQVSGRGPCLSHLIFADNTLIFLKATKTNCTNIVKLLDSYYNASGQEVEDSGNYLGILTIWGRSKKNALTYVKDRIMAKIIGWKQQFLSQSSKETLIKAVAQAVPTYPMNVFKLPENLCSDIDVALARF
ncbi:hypothetical protein ACFX12_024832 [Malus domestica]